LDIYDVDVVHLKDDSGQWISPTIPRSTRRQPRSVRFRGSRLLPGGARVTVVRLKKHYEFGTKINLCVLGRSVASRGGLVHVRRPVCIFKRKAEV